MLNWYKRGVLPRKEYFENPIGAVKKANNVITEIFQIALKIGKWCYPSLYIILKIVDGFLESRGMVYNFYWNYMTMVSLATVIFLFLLQLKGVSIFEWFGKSHNSKRGLEGEVKIGRLSLWLQLGIYRICPDIFHEISGDESWIPLVSLT